MKVNNEMDTLINKDWSKEEAIEADLKFVKNGGNPLSINAPFNRWLSLHDLDEYQRRFENGEKFALMLAIRTCAEFKFVMPQWASEAYLKAMNPIMNYETKNWNEVFGSPVKKGARLPDLRKKHLLEKCVYSEIKRIILKNPKRAIEGDLFDEVGGKFHIGKTAAEEYYRSMIKKGWDPMTEIKENIDDPEYQHLRKIYQE